METPSIVKTPNKCEDWLTPDTEYKVINAGGKESDPLGFNFELVCDHGIKIFTNQYKSSHLLGGDWIIIK